MSGWYLDGKEQLLARTVPQAAGVYLVGVNDEYIFDPNHVDFTPITPCIVLDEVELLGATFVGGLLDTPSHMNKWVGAGANIVDARSRSLIGVIVYFQLAGQGTLLAFIDGPAIGLPLAVNGVDVTGHWSNGLLRL